MRVGSNKIVGIILLRSINQTRLFLFWLHEKGMPLPCPLLVDCDVNIEPKQIKDDRPIFAKLQEEIEFLGF